MNILLKECNNKLIVISNNGLNYIFSYDTLIGLYYNNNLLLNEYYINYSNTTDKHINYIKQYYYLNNESNIIYLNYDSFNNLIKDPNKIECYIKYFNDNNYLYEYIKDYKNIFNNKQYDPINFYDTFINLKERIHITNKNYKLNIITDYIKEYKTVTKHYIIYKVNNITFTLIKTYNNNNNKNLKYIRIKNIKFNPI